MHSTTNRLAFAFFLLCGTLCAQTVTPPQHTGSTQYIQAKLDKQIRSGATVDGGKAFGGTVEVPAGELVWKTGVRISNAQVIDGQGTPTRITFLGEAGTAAIEIVAYPGESPYIDQAGFRDLQIECPRGGKAVRVVRVGPQAVTTVKRLKVENVTIKSGGIDLSDNGQGGGEHYGCIFDDVEIIDPKGQALRIDGQAHVLRSLHVFGSSTSTQPVVEIRGSATFEGFCWIEGSFSAPLLKLVDWKSKNADGSFYSHRGNFDATNLWLESHKNGTAFEISIADFEGLNFGGTAATPVVLNDAGLYLRRPVNAGAVKIAPGDSKSKVFILGRDVTAETQN